jgi:uncharacterized protein with PIN domain
METKFVADSMLGKLAKWLRVLGYDTHYQRHYSPGVMDELVKGSRLLLSRRRETVHQYTGALLLHGNAVGEQIAELKERLHLVPDRSRWFTRCLICNILLGDVQIDTARENVPEYVFYQNISGIKYCPSCGRYYWPGSHRTRMERQLENSDNRQPSRPGAFPPGFTGQIDGRQTEDYFFFATRLFFAAAFFFTTRLFFAGAFFFTTRLFFAGAFFVFAFADFSAALAFLSWASNFLTLIFVAASSLIAFVKVFFASRNLN